MGNQSSLGSAARSFILLAGADSLPAGSIDFFPKDLSYLSYLDVWLPEDAPLSATNESRSAAEEVVREAAQEYGKVHPGKMGSAVRSLNHSQFVGGGGPRFWFSSAELQKLNYAQLVIQVRDKHDTNDLIGLIQSALDEKVPGARKSMRDSSVQANPSRCRSKFVS